MDEIPLVKNRTIRLKKRHKGYAEIRSYALDVAKSRKQGIRFVYNEGGKEEVMTVPYEELGNGIVTARNIRSKINRNQVFDLISYKWVSDEDREQEDQQTTIWDFGA